MDVPNTRPSFLEASTPQASISASGTRLFFALAKAEGSLIFTAVLDGLISGHWIVAGTCIIAVSGGMTLLPSRLPATPTVQETSHLPPVAPTEMQRATRPVEGREKPQAGGGAAGRIRGLCPSPCAARPPTGDSPCTEGPRPQPAYGAAVPRCRLTDVLRGEGEVTRPARYRSFSSTSCSREPVRDCHPPHRSPGPADTTRRPPRHIASRRPRP